jgi:hypothetical protein
MATEFMFGTLARLSMLDLQNSSVHDVNSVLRDVHVSGCNFNEQEALSPSSNMTMSLVEEIVPRELQPTYAPENLQFNVTRSMIRQSRPIIGNTERLHAYIKKLHSKKCTSVLFLGGSVTGESIARYCFG